MKESNAPATSGKKRILCVEDDKDTCELLGLLFGDYEVVFANGTRDAFAQLESRHFDLYVLDNWLPDGSGIEVCKKIHALTPDVPIIFTSAVGHKAEIKKALDAGARQYLIKPYDPEELQKVVKDLLAEKRS